LTIYELILAMRKYAEEIVHRNVTLHLCKIFDFCFNFFKYYIKLLYKYARLTQRIRSESFFIYNDLTHPLQRHA